MEKFLQKRKKRKSFMAVFGFLLLLSGFAACGKKQEIDPGIPLQKLVMEYPLNNPVTYAGAEDGGVYIINLDIIEGGDGETAYQLHHFDGQGDEDWHINLEDYSMVEALALSEDGKLLYFTAQGNGVEICLFAYSLEDGGITQLCVLSYFDHVRQLAVVGDVVYLLGQSPNWQAKKPPDDGFSFSGERLVAYHCGSGEQVQLGFDFPVSMSASGAGTLMVFGYLDGDGYCMMEYDPIKDTMQVISRLDHYKFSYFAACNGGKDIIYDYTSDSRGLVLSDVTEISVETELFPDSLPGIRPPGYAGGRVYCYEWAGHLVSFPLDTVKKDNKVLTFISTEYGTLNSPYGCGYSIQRLELSKEKFTLKVLARDRDFDLCMGNTLLGDGGNFQDSGIFYPLNDIPAVEEYFDRCFPYVREAATKKDGTIWMLPVDVNMYGMVVRQKAAEEAGLSLYNGMTWEEFAQEIQKAPEEDRKWIDARPYFMTMVFEFQYFTHYHTLEGELFPDVYRAMSEICGADCGGGIPVERWILHSMGGPLWVGAGDSVRREYGEDAVFLAMPKLNAADRNIANCIFLAVNPDSEKRDEALAYIAALAAYLSQNCDQPFYKDWQGEGILDETLHTAYENGEIGFAVDYDAYGQGFEELFSGEMSLSEYIKMTEPKLRMYWEE